MFYADNTEIGIYVSDKIKSRFETSRDFCRKWLELNNEQITEDTITNKANKLSQIKNGAKGIQTYDLPVFSELLNLSCEQILSAGKCNAYQPPRINNYYIAQSQNEYEWEQYINRPDKPITHKDEFGITAIEYAIRFKNYNFIKYLTEKKYIWFCNRENQDFTTSFGAGTSIKITNSEEREDGLFVRNPEIDDLEYTLNTQAQLRTGIIALACENCDFNMLDELKAREIPELYHKTEFSSSLIPKISGEFRAEDLMIIANSDKSVLEYFTNNFDVYSKDRSRKGTFVFPYISELLDCLISIDSPFVNKALKKMIDHNKTVYTTLRGLINDPKTNTDFNSPERNRGLFFYDDLNIVYYRDLLTVTSYLTNTATATKQSKSLKTNKLIIELNDLYDAIKNEAEGKM